MPVGSSFVFHYMPYMAGSLRRQTEALGISHGGLLSLIHCHEAPPTSSTHPSVVTTHV